MAVAAARYVLPGSARGGRDPLRLQRKDRLNVGVVGAGISGLAAAWLISSRHDVTVYERAPRIGGHSDTAMVAGPDGVSLPVDTGFIVYNPPAYPNLTALFAHLGVATKPSDMSLSVSLGSGQLEYAGSSLNALFAQRSNMVSPRFWAMLRDIRRFYREAESDALLCGDAVTLGSYLTDRGYSRAFRDDHLLPMAAAIWSASPQALLQYPFAAFVRFCANHGLLQIYARPQWRTVEGGSQAYVARLARSFRHRVRVSSEVVAVSRSSDGAGVRTADGAVAHHDHVVVAAHADEALALLADADEDERRLLSAFTYTANLAVLHSDSSLMPRRRAAWSSWNYAGETDRLCVTYWMNRLQGIRQEVPLFVTLNPVRQPSEETVHQRKTYTHPMFNTRALAAQRQLWSLQGKRNTWFCGAYFGAGFHEDGLQSGLAVAEHVAGIARPWQVQEPSGRIFERPAVSVVAAGAP